MYLLSVWKVWFVETRYKETLRNGIFSSYATKNFYVSVLHGLPDGDIIWSLLKKFTDAFDTTPEQNCP